MSLFERNKKTIVTCAKLSRIAYDDVFSNEFNLRHLDKMNMVPLGLVGNRCWFYTNNIVNPDNETNLNRSLYVIFRGSDSFDDLALNCNMFGHELHQFEGKVHMGFWNYYNDIRTCMLHFLDNNYFDTINVAGHSLGGTSAIISSIDMLDRCDKINVITFGSPRLADNDFANAFKTTHINCIRVHHPKDIATHISLPTFNHVGRSLPLTNIKRSNIFHNHYMNTYLYGVRKMNHHNPQKPSIHI